MKNLVVLAISIYMLAIIVGHSESANILAIFPFPGPSQYILVLPYLKTLADRGHNVTVINAFPQKKPIPNFRDISVADIIKLQDEMIESIQTERNFWQELNYFSDIVEDIQLNVLNNKEVQTLLKSETETFDLVIVETIRSEVLYGFAAHFNALLIGVSSFGTDVEIDELVGNISPSSYIPSVLSEFTDRMSCMERLKNFVNNNLQILHTHFIHIPRQKKLYSKYFPHVKVPLEAVRNNFSLMLLNQHFSLSFPRPYVPSMIQVGGLHISHKPSPLPPDIADFINGGENGVIYFSMGSNVKSKNLPKETIDVLLKVFASLPQRVLWKFEDENLAGKPDNVFINKWFPQPDILAHPNVKLFITHGGLLSTMEAIYHAKPVIGLPVFYDQFLNVARAVKTGFGLSADLKKLDTQSLRSKIESILNDKSYAKKARAISNRYHDQPIKPMDAAIYWTEYVLRHKGAPHMRVAAQDLNVFQLYCLDSVCMLVTGTILVFGIVIGLVVKLLGCALRKPKTKRKFE
ncbi:UDP-glucosyltransferase 2-like [Teleopsis dalmanni]|uniref:UDP-glucosyltransferase 2-like n=1 Tax=Teleopsis dalmanni TaxID=139649 RepID=UPI0018CE15EC|nr:UDP-glucosyltransferase 2-like [Teleopsis dalmanni]XP_037945446.1 UDP-glucosyltransferase 2-like [Teleopsis dalmanni]